MVDVSATAIRDRVQAEKSITGLVPDSVADYIAANELYR
jgi:nicotinic acid mononucleotide adenylyltransferase